MSTKNWVITGISSGLGKELAEYVINQGDFVIGTFRNQQQVDSFNYENSDKAKAYLLNVDNIDEGKDFVQQVLTDFNHIDVLVNNAGYGLGGAIEETSMDEAKEMFDTNYFGAINLIQQFLPSLRAQKSGHIINLSSQAGFKAGPGFGIYNSTKFAIEGMSEALSMELAPVGIKVTIIQPGPFRTNFAGSSFKFTDKIIDDYARTSGVFRKRIGLINGTQEGDPTKAAEAIYNITLEEKPPLKLPLGKSAVVAIQQKLDAVKLELDKYTAIAEATVFPK